MRQPRFHKPRLKRPKREEDEVQVPSQNYSDVLVLPYGEIPPPVSRSSYLYEAFTAFVLDGEVHIAYKRWKRRG